MDQLNVSLVQTQQFWEDKQENFTHITGLVENALTEQTDLLVLPEMFNTSFSMNAEQLAEPLEGESFLFLKKLALKFQTAVYASVITKIDEKYFNTAYFVYPNGDYETYNKRHLFRMAGEDKIYTPGDERKVVDYKGWKILLQICYDLRFPVFSRNQNDYDLSLYIANWPAVRSSAWDALLKARAIENLAYVVGVNRVGEDGNQIKYDGHSKAVDFKGEELLSLLDFEEGILQISLHKDLLKGFRDKFPAFMDSDEFEIKK